MMELSLRQDAPLCSPQKIKSQSYVPLNSPSYRRKLLQCVRRSPVAVKRAISSMSSPVSLRRKREGLEREDLYVIRLV